MVRRTKEQQAEWAAKRTKIVSSYESGGDWRNLANALWFGYNRKWLVIEI